MEKTLRIFDTVYFPLSLPEPQGDLLWIFLETTVDHPRGLLPLLLLRFYLCYTFFNPPQLPCKCSYQFMAPRTSAAGKQILAVPLDALLSLSRYQDSGSQMGLRKVIDFHFDQLFLVIRKRVMTSGIFPC